MLRFYMCVSHRSMLYRLITLQQCVSTRAKTAIGANHYKSSSGSFDIEIRVGDDADFVIFGLKSEDGKRLPRGRRTCQDLVNDAGFHRETVYRGRVVSSR